MRSDLSSQGLLAVLLNKKGHDLLIRIAKYIIALYILKKNAYTRNDILQL